VILDDIFCKYKLSEPFEDSLQIQKFERENSLKKAYVITGMAVFCENIPLSIYPN
jgi:hypothetical protein